MTETILVATDLLSTSQVVLTEAARLASALRARLCLVHADTSRLHSGAVEFGLDEELRQIEGRGALERDALEEYGRTLSARGIEVEPIFARGMPGQVILAQARRLHPIMIVLGFHRHEIRHCFLTHGLCRNLTNHAPCPILLVPL